MKPLATNRRFLTWLCICPLDRDTSIWKKVLCVISTLFLFASEVSVLMSSAVFFANNLSIDLEGCLHAVFQITGFSLIYECVVGFILRKRINRFLGTLDSIYEENSDFNSINHLKHANDKSELLWKYYSKFLLPAFAINTIGMALTSFFYCYLTRKGFDYEYLYSPYKLALPWNQRTPIGYCGMIFYTVLVAESYLIFNGSILLLFISISWHHQAFYGRFRDSVLKLNNRQQFQNTKTSLSEVIRFHIRVKSWFVETANVFSPYVLIQLICSVVALAAATFQLDLQMDHLDFNFIMILMAAIVGIANLFLYCYFGMIASESYEKMSSCLFESHWYEHAVEMQKYFVLMLQNIQKPIYYHGFGIANLELVNFTGMLRMVISYYLMFKTITDR